MPQYSGVWNLAQQAQALTSQQWVTDPNFNNTTLLLQADNAANSANNSVFLDSSTNSFPVTRNGGAPGMTQGTFTPFSQSPGRWSNYFGGTNDYLTSATSSSYAFGTGDFTVEAWVYVTSLPAARMVFDTRSSAATSGMGFGIDSSGKLRYSDSANNLLTTTAIAINSWYHVAWVRSGTTLTGYINGINGGSVTNSANLTTTNGVIAAVAFSSGERMEGYISNLRVLKGTAQYTSNFIPPASPLTAITNTSLLTCQSNRFIDNGTANAGTGFTITPTGSPSVQPFAPFAPQYQWTPTVTGGSAYFDGTGDYLSVADNAALEPGNSSFTLECWFYATATPPTFGATVLAKSATSSYGPFLIIIDPTSRYLYGYASSTGSSWNIVCNNTTVTALNTWYHVALVRSGSNFALFVNGSRAPTTATSTATLIDNTDPFAVGYANYGSTNFTGYISSVRYVVGTALYDPTLSTCTVPTAPLTAVANTKVLLNMTNAGIYDATMNNVLETVGNASVSTTVVKYGSGSMYFDGSGDSLYNARFIPIGNGDFTIEGWFYQISGTGTYRTFVTTRTSSPYSGNDAVFVGISSSDKFYYDGSGGGTITISSLGTVVNNTWNHLAIVRFGSIVTMYLNGVAQGTVTDANNKTNTVLSIGDLASSLPFNGYMDDVRITKGLARYTANFTPPQVALPRQ